MPVKQVCAKHGVVSVQDWSLGEFLGSDGTIAPIMLLSVDTVQRLVDSSGNYDPERASRIAVTRPVAVGEARPPVPPREGQLIYQLLRPIAH